MIIKYALYSDAGDRVKNEDYIDFMSEDNCSCFVIADGLGGHKNGEIASRVISNSIINDFKQSESIDKESIMEYFSNAHMKLKKMQFDSGTTDNYKSTAVAFFIKNNKTRIAHVGDSRIYIFRDGKVYYQTKDHSVVRMLVELGEIKYEEMRSHEDRNKLLKVLGMNSDIVKCEISREESAIKVNDRLLLCTDGVWKLIDDKTLLEISNKSNTPEEWIINIENYIKNLGLKNKDNNSCCVIIVEEGE